MVNAFFRRNKRPFTHVDVKRSEDLNRLDKQGLIEFLKSDREDKADLWLNWRENTSSADVDLSRANLYGADLKRVNLAFVNLNGAKLGEAQLSGATLIKTQLVAAFLTKAHLDGADLQYANLTNAILEGAHLERADLREANLSGAYLRGVYLAEANLIGAILCDADLRLAYLRDTALSPIASGGLRGVKLYQTYFWGVLSLRYDQFLEDEKPNGPSTIWEHTEGRFAEAKDIYKTLKGYFEDVGDYEGANWAYQQEQSMEKLMVAPAYVRWLHFKWNQRGSDWNLTHERQREIEFNIKIEGTTHPNRNVSLLNWVRLVLANALAGYGLSLARPLIWLVTLMFVCGVIYGTMGMITTMPGCGYDELRAALRTDCEPTMNLIASLRYSLGTMTSVNVGGEPPYLWDIRPLDAFQALIAGLKFSLGAMTTIDVGGVQPYLSEVGLLAAAEALIAIALTGLFGFVLGNNLRNS